DARAERGFFVFFRRSFEFVPRRKPHSVGSINLDRVMAITSENHETMRMVSIVRHARPSGRSLSARVRPHVPRMEDDCAVAARDPSQKVARKTKNLIFMSPH